MAKSITTAAEHTREPQGGARRTGAIALPFAILAVMTIAVSALSACNTTEGFGEDVQSAGAGIQHSAEKNK